MGKVKRLKGEPTKKQTRTVLKAWKNIIKKKATDLWSHCVTSFTKLLQARDMLQNINRHQFLFFCSPTIWVISHQSCHILSYLTYLDLNSRTLKLKMISYSSADRKPCHSNTFGGDCIVRQIRDLTLLWLLLYLTRWNLFSIMLECNVIFSLAMNKLWHEMGFVWVTRVWDKTWKCEFYAKGWELWSLWNDVGSQDALKVFTPRMTTCFLEQVDTNTDAETEICNLLIT